MPETSLTLKRDLRDSLPLWQTTPRISVVTKKHVTSRSYDVVIVGAGISGALMAHALADGTRSILIVDRRAPVSGSSMASTAMIQHEIDVPLTELSAMIGEKSAGQVWRRSARAVEELIALTQGLGLECRMRRKQTLFLAGDAYGSRALKAEAQARIAAGLKADYLDGSQVRDLYGLDRTAAIRTDVSASANPAQLTAGILRSVRNRGAEIVSGVEITDLHSACGEVCLATADGQLIVARHVVFCTGYEFLNGLAAREHSVISTWAIASRPHVKLPGWLSDCLVWEGADPYLYFRTTGDGRLIAGGEDEKDPQAHQSPEKLKAKSARIAEKVGDLLGCSIGKPDFSWAAAFGTTTTGLPFIGAVPGIDNVFAVMGFGGNGITFSQIAAGIVSASIDGKRDPDAPLFVFPASARKPVAGLSGAA